MSTANKAQEDLVGELTRRSDALFSERASFNNTWDDVVKLVLPRRQGFSSQVTNGQRVAEQIFDSTAPWALDQLASGLHSYLTSPVQRWFRLRLPEYLQEIIGEDEEVDIWLENVTNIMYGVFNSEASNFNSQAHEAYLDIGAFGTFVMYSEEDYAKVPLRFCTYHLADCAIGEDQYGRVNTLYRKFEWTGRQILSEFGPSAVGSVLLEKMQKDLSKKFNLIHATEPRHDFDPLSKGRAGMPYRSYYFIVEEKKILRAGGYREFPYFVPRWSKLTGELYGRSPAMLCMPDIKMTNKMQVTVLKAAQKKVDPPLMLPDEGFLMPIRTAPASLNYYNASMSPEHRIAPLETNGDVNLGLDMIDSRRQQILRAFYVDYMQMQQGPQMTATEVLARQEEKMRLMAPALSRLQSEFLNPLIDRTFEVLRRKDLIPDLPAAFEGRSFDLKVEYVSPIARAQNMSQVENFLRYLELLGQVGQIKPEIFDRIDPDGTAKFIGEALDISHRTLLTDKVVEKTRDERKKAIKDSQDAELANKDSQTEANLAKAEGATQ